MGKFGRPFSNTNEFLEKALIVHNNLYDYSKVIYKGSQKKVVIGCPNHGKFEQRPDVHLRGSGCPVCAREKTSGLRTITTENFIERANEIHNYKYCYDKVIYKRCNKSVIIICPIHGEFKQVATEHLRGAGCRECQYKDKRRTKEEFVEKSRNIHGDDYDYSLVDYKNCDTKVKIICRKHGIFEQTPYHHLKGGRCVGCAASGFDIFKPAILYYVCLNNELYKIGVTNRTVDERFYPESVDYRLICSWEYPFGREALDKEQEILNLFQAQLYTGKSPMRITGTSEVFYMDVLGYDKSHETQSDSKSGEKDKTQNSAEQKEIHKEKET